jgi:hypothetical protein
MPGHTSPLRFVLGVALIVAGALSTSCHKGPTDPSDNVTENFTGTIPFVSGMPGFAVHFFSASNDGELFVSLVSLTPAPTAGVFASLWLGANNGGTCVWNGAQDNRALAGTVISVSIGKGDACVGLFDQAYLGGGSGFTTTEDYQIKVSHP